MKSDRLKMLVLLIPAAAVHLVWCVVFAANSTVAIFAEFLPFTSIIHNLETFKVSFP